MKTIALAATIVVSTFASAYALTTEDIKPAALVGKTLNFQITEGESPFPTQGSWTGTFSAGSNFKITKISANIPNLSTTYTANFDNNDKVTFIKVNNFIKGQAPAELILFVDDTGLGRYDVMVPGLSSGYFSGTFTITTAPVGEISIKLKGKELVDGKASAALGKVKVGKVSKKQVFTIANVGTGSLDKLAISISGKNKKDFKITKLSSKSLAPKKSINISVTFKPTSTGLKNALLTVKSTDADEGTFDIKLKGTAQKGK